MRIIRKQLQKGMVTVAVDSADDLWFLSHITEPGDTVEGKTVRKIAL